jgi:hypothetical protein
VTDGRPELLPHATVEQAAQAGALNPIDAAAHGPKFLRALALAHNDVDADRARERALAELAHARRRDADAPWLYTADRVDSFLADWAQRRLAELDAMRAETRSRRLSVLQVFARLHRNGFGPMSRPYSATIGRERFVSARVPPGEAFEVYSKDTGRFVVASLPGHPFKVDESRDPE